MIERPPDHILVDPSHHAKGSIGIEQEENYLGVYTACCYSDPESLGVSWVCRNCNKVLEFVWAYHGMKTTYKLERAKSAPTSLTEWLCEWMGWTFSSTETWVDFPKEV